MLEFLLTSAVIFMDDAIINFLTLEAFESDNLQWLRMIGIPLVGINIFLDRVWLRMLVPSISVLSRIGMVAAEYL